MFAVSPRDPVDIGALVSRTAAGPAAREAFRTALQTLANDGAAFKLVIETITGRRLRAQGEIQGRQALVVFHDETDMWAQLDATTREVENARNEAARSAAALDAAGDIAWIVNAAGDVAWSSSGRDAAVPALRRALDAAKGDNVRHDGALYRLARRSLPGGETLMTATGQVPAQEGEATFARFVNTMSETFAHLKVALMIFDNDRRLILFNPATVRMFSADAAFLARRPTLKVILDAMREARVVPEQTDYQAWRDGVLARLSTEGEGDIDGDWHLADGRTLHVIARPHPSGGLAMTAEDITESVALRRSNASERAVLHATTDLMEEGLIVFGPDGVSRVRNDAFLQIWTPPEDMADEGGHIRDVARHCATRVAAGDFWREAAEAVTGGPERRSFKMKVELRDGRILSARYSPMPDGASLLVFADVTASERVAVALRERNEALEHSEEMRGALVDQISHQMRTPLNAVFGFGQLLMDQSQAPLTPAQSDYVAGILSSANELLDAIVGMTDLITVEPDALSLGGEALDPAAVAAEVVALSVRRFEEKAGRIIADYSDAPPRFFAHKVRFRQIVFNLLMDALSKSPPGDVVKLSLAEEGDRLLLTCVHRTAGDMGERGLAISLIRRFLGLYGGVLTIEAADGVRKLVCRLPECRDLTGPGPLLAEEPLAAEGRTV